MMLKRLDLGTGLGSALLLAAVAASAGAQNSGGTWRKPAQGAVRQGIEVRQPPAVVVDPTLLFPNNPSFPARPVSFALVPAVLMSDGSIFADFGFGFEPVVRPCNGAVVVGQPQPLRRIAGSGFVLSEPNRAPYTQPVPNQQTASQQMVAQSGSRLSGAAQLACFSRDAAGRVFVFRRL